MKTCPFCAETDLQDAAVVCKHCSKDLPGTPAAMAVKASNRAFNYGAIFLVGGLLIALVLPPVGAVLVVVGIVWGTISLLQSIHATVQDASRRQFSKAERIVASICLPIVALSAVLLLSVYIVSLFRH